MITVVEIKRYVIWFLLGLGVWLMTEPITNQIMSNFSNKITFLIGAGIVIGVLWFTKFRI
jgi:hypothetical protein